MRRRSASERADLGKTFAAAGLPCCRSTARFRSITRSISVPPPAGPEDGHRSRQRLPSSGIGDFERRQPTASTNCCVSGSAKFPASTSSTRATAQVAVRASGRRPRAAFGLGRVRRGGAGGGARSGRGGGRNRRARLCRLNGGGRARREQRWGESAGREPYAASRSRSEQKREGGLLHGPSIVPTWAHAKGRSSKTKE
jgi:hypothetical protein